MGGRRFKIEGVPGMDTTQGVPRKLANVEAEKGETMVTTDGVSNQKLMVAIGGKKHSEGGTALDAPEGSIIFSDKLKIKDPVILKFFNEKGKKPKTFAEISKKYDITKFQEELKNEDIDKITKDSLNKNMENSAFKLSALFTMQEFDEKKGGPDEHSKQFEPFLERMGLDYDQILGASKEGEQPVVEEPMSRDGSEVKFKTLPEYAEGGGVGTEIVRAPPYDEARAYTKEGIERLNKYMKIYNLPELPLDTPPRVVKSKMKEIQRAAIKENPDLVFDFMTTDDDVTTKSHRPNDKLQGIMNTHKDKHPPKGKDGSYTNDDLREMISEGLITTDNIADAYEDGKWWYRMVNSDITDISKQEMDKLVATDQYKNAPEQNGLKYIHQGDGYYKAYKTKEDGTVVEVEADPAVVDELYKWDIKPMDVDPETERNMDFLWSNKRALKQAKKNKRNIPYLEPMTATPETYYTDQAYYSPDQAINSIQSMVNTQGTKQAMFAPQQQQTANFLAGQQFDLMGKVIGQYEDKNVNAYNQERNMNTQIANRSAERLASAITGHHDKTTALKQNFANAMRSADNNIAENEIAMWQERADRLNLEATIGEQYAKDPNTGIHEFQKGKDLAPSSGTTKTVADTYNELVNSLPPGTDEATIAKLALAQHSPKYQVQSMSRPDNLN